jgi:TetR/AcrR family tetracycline transcriptional repressor
MTIADSPRRRRPRRALLTRDAVVEAGARVMARDGYAGLTMRAIAVELGVQAPALYWYVGSKEELEALLYDHLMAGFEITLAGDDWRENIRQAAQQLRRHLRSKRDISHLIPWQLSLGPNSSAQLEGALTILRGAGLGARDAAYAFNLLFNYVVDWAGGEAAAQDRQHAAVELELNGSPLDISRFPNVAESSEFLVRDDADGRFEFGLECMIAGLAERIGTPSEG